MKRKGTIRVEFMDSDKYPFGVDFDGFNEGSGSPCEDEEEVKETINSLLARHRNNYILEVIDNRKKEKQMTLL